MSKLHDFYEAFTANGNNIGTEEQFSAAMQDKLKRFDFWQRAKANGNNLGSFEQFNNAMTEPDNAPAQAPQRVTMDDVQQAAPSVGETDMQQTKGAARLVKPTMGAAPYNLAFSNPQMPDTDYSQKQYREDPLAQYKDKSSEDLEAMKASLESQMPDQAYADANGFKAFKKQQRQLYRQIKDINQELSNREFDTSSMEEIEAEIGRLKQRREDLAKDNKPLERENLELLNLMENYVNGKRQRQLFEESRERAIRAQQRTGEDAALTPYITQIVDDAMKLLNAQDKSRVRDASSRAGAFFTGLGDGLADIDTWSFGISEIARAGKLKDIAEKANSGKDLTEAETDLLLAYLNYSEVQDLRRNNVSSWYSGGKKSAESLPFMAELFGTAGIGAAATKALTRQLVKRGMTSAARKLERLAAGKLTQGLVNNKVGQAVVSGTEKVANAVAKDVAMTAAMPTTYQQMSNSQLQHALDNEDYTFKDYMRDFASATVETAMEREGGKLIDSALSGIGGAVFKGAKKVLGGEYSGQMFNHMKHIGGDVLQSTPGEIGEEYLGAVVNYLRSYNPAYSDKSNEQLRAEAEEMFTPEGAATTAIAIVPQTLLMGGVNYLGYAKAASKFDRQKENLRNRLISEGASETEADRILTDIEQSNDMTAVNAKLDFLNEAVKGKHEGDMEAAKTMEQLVKNYAAAALNMGEELSSLTEDYNKLTDEEKAEVQKQLGEFVAKYRSEDPEVQRAINRIDDKTNAQTGSIVEVSVEGLGRCNVKDGNITIDQNDEGDLFVDNAQTDDVLVVEDEAGNVHQIGRDKIVEVGGEVSSVEAKRNAVAAINARRGFIREGYKPGGIVRDETTGAYSPVVDVTANGPVILSIDEEGNPTLAPITEEGRQAVRPFNVEPGQTIEIGGQTVEVADVTPDGYVINEEGQSVTLSPDEFAAMLQGLEEQIREEEAQPEGQTQTEGETPTETTTTAPEAIIGDRYQYGQAEAEVVAVENGKVVLKMQDGRTIEVDPQALAVMQKLEPQAQAEQAAAPSTPEQRWAEFVQKKGSEGEAENAVRVTTAAINQKMVKKTEQLQKELAKLRTMPEAFDKESETARAKQEKKVADIQSEINELEKARAQYTELSDIVSARDQARREAEAQAARQRAEAKRLAASNTIVDQQTGRKAYQPEDNIRQKYEDADKKYGVSGTRTTPTGQKLKGRYVLFPAGATTPSHNPETWQTSEGFPLNEKGQNVNSRDYKNSEDNKRLTEGYARNFDGRAITNMPIHTTDGVVVDGNGRTMAGQLAATNQTDEQYLDALRENAQMYGFTEEDVNAIPHARIGFEIDAPEEYTPAYFHEFNKEEKKTEDSVEAMVRISKTLSDETIDRLHKILNRYETLEGFWTSPTACADMVQVLQQDGVISAEQLPQLTQGVEGGRLFSAQGKDAITTLILGSIFSETALRRLATMPAVRQKMLRSASLLVENKLLREYSAIDNIEQAIEIVNEAQDYFKNDDNKPKKFVSSYLYQSQNGDLFGNKQTPLASKVFAVGIAESTIEEFKQIVESYNEIAKPLVGGQMDIWGNVANPEDILQEFAQHINDQYNLNLTDNGQANQGADRGSKGPDSNEGVPQGNEEGSGERQGEQVTPAEPSAVQPDTNESEVPGDGISEGTLFSTGRSKSTLATPKHIQDAIDELGMSELPIHIVTNKNQLPQSERSAYKAIKNGLMVEGWYNTSTGEVYLYAPNIQSKERAKQVLLHEAVAHKGLRDLLGKSGFDKFVREVWSSMSREQRKRAVAYVKYQDEGHPISDTEYLQSAGFTFKAAADEFLAHLAEKGIEDSLWSKVKAALKAALRAAGFNIRLTDNDYRRLLRESRDAMRNGAEAVTTDEGTRMSAKGSKVDEKQLSLFIENNSGEYESEDGTKTKFTSALGVAEDLQHATTGTADAGRKRAGRVQRETDLPDTAVLRRLKPGETCHVERRFKESNAFDFTGKEKIESADDVAYIFRQLENESVENVFFVLVKDGKPTILHAGMGGYAMSIAAFGGVISAVNKIKPEKIYFVHNHPSGNLVNSQQDVATLNSLTHLFPRQIQDGIIIDTTSGKYGTFSLNERNTDNQIPKSQQEHPLKLYSFTKQVFEKDWNPESAFAVTNSNDVAEFISSHRLGEHEKVSLLVLNRQNKITGNVFLPYTEINDSKDVADTIAYYVHQMGGEGAILVGTAKVDADSLKEIHDRLKYAQVSLMDSIVIGDSAGKVYVKSSAANEGQLVNDNQEVYRNSKGEVMTPKNTSLDEVLFSIKVNHNSPYLLKKADGSFRDPETGERLGFDHRFMGRGEGAQAHGWGSYFSVNDIRWYAQNPSHTETYIKIGNWYPGSTTTGKENVYDYAARIIRDEGNTEKALERLRRFNGWIESKYDTNSENYKLTKAAEDFIKTLPRLTRSQVLYKSVQIKDPRHHYDVEIPDNIGTNYLDEDKPLSEEDNALIRIYLEQEILVNDEEGAYKGHENDLVEELRRSLPKDANGREVYGTIVDYFGSPEAASKFLYEHGYVGIHYDGRRDGECYVIFNEDDARIIDHTRFSIVGEKGARELDAKEGQTTNKQSKAAQASGRNAYESGEVFTTGELFPSGLFEGLISEERDVPKAELATRLDNLETAKKMEAAGKDKRRIWDATGWERGTDGKWRYEIDNPSLSNKVWDKLQNSQKGFTTTLADVIGKDSRVLKAYPNLADFKVLFSKEEPNSTAGKADYKGRKMKISTAEYTNVKKANEINDRMQELRREVPFNKDEFDKLHEEWKENVKLKLQDKSEIENTLAHEIQHFIQREEGFAIGGSPGALDRNSELFARWKRLYDEYKELDARSIPTPEQRARKNAVASAANRLRRLIPTINYDEYNRLAGEVEARNASRRNSAERMVPPISDTEDVARDEQIVWLPEGEEPDAQVRYSVVNDKNLIDKLENGEKKTGYRTIAMNQDGTFGSPMAGRIGSRGTAKAETSPFRLNKWEQADEHPELATDNGKIDLIKPNGRGTVGSVDYNPYIHIRPDAVNTQFSQAWMRPELVYVETQYPKSELDGKYKADKAKLSTGLHDWNGGQLILSRYDKPIRVMPWEEVADVWADRFKDKGVTFDIVAPAMRYPLAKRGVEILPPKKAAGKKAMEAYNEWKSSINYNGEYLNSKGDIRFSVTPQQDKAYLDALKRGDMETAQRMVNEAAKAAGYNSNSDYQGSLAFNGSAPSSNGYYETKEERKEAFDNGDFEDTYSLGDFVDNGVDGNDLGWQLDNPIPASGRDKATLQSIENLRKVVKSGKRKIKMYRAVDSNIKEDSFRNGDWITPSQLYAKQHISLQDWENGRIIEQEVPIDDVWWNGDDINEWGYDDGRGYAYKNTPNNRKLLDPVTYDDQGNVIPLSERFNPNNNDIRFSVTPTYDISSDNSLTEDAKKEMQAIKDEAIKNGTFMKAPNGKPTNLNERQWLQVRTKAFIKWFGDWLKAARIEKLRKSENVQIKGDEFALTGDYKQDRKNAIEYGRKFTGEYTNEDTGKSISLRSGKKNGGLFEILEHDYKDAEHIASIAAIPQIIEKSIYVDTVENEDKQKHPNVLSYDYYVCGLKIGDKDYTVKAVVSNMDDGSRYYDHKLTKIEKGKLIDIIKETPSSSVSITTQTPDKDVLSDVKDKRLISILQTNSSKVVDENGEPMEVYHGSNQAGFSEFWVDGRGKTRDTGAFFAEKKQNAASYSRSTSPVEIEDLENNDEDSSYHYPGIYSVFLNIKNPDVYDFNGNSWDDVNGEMWKVYNEEGDVEQAFATEQEAEDYANKRTEETGESYRWEEDPYVETIDDVVRDVRKGYTSDGQKKDGVYAKNIYDGGDQMMIGNEWVVFYPSQVKSADFNNGDFNENDGDIRFSVRQNSEGEYLNSKGEVMTPKNTSLDEVMFSVKVNHNSPYLLKNANGAFVDAKTGERLGFDHRFVGSGEGAQVHGWGSYFSVNDIRAYAQNGSGHEVIYNGKAYDFTGSIEETELLDYIGNSYINPNTHLKGKKDILDFLDSEKKRAEKGDWKQAAIERIDRMKSTAEKIGDNVEVTPRERHHYDVEIPDNNGTNYLDEDKTLPKPMRRRIADAVRGLEGEPAKSVKYVDYKGGWNQLASMIERNQWAYEEIRDRLVQALGGRLTDEKRLSDLMSDAGFVGIHYNGRRDGECYVIFNENDAKIIDHTRFSVAPSNPKPTMAPGESPVDFLKRYGAWVESQRNPLFADAYNNFLKKMNSLSSKANAVIFDRLKPIEEFESWIKKMGGTVDDESDAYKDEFLSRGRAGLKMRNFRDVQVKNLLDRMKVIIDSKELESIDLKWHNVDTGMSAERHNGKRLTPREILGVYAQAKDVQEAKTMGLPDRGEAGFVNDLGVTYDQVIGMVESALPKQQIDDLWGAIRQCTKFALDELYQGGMIDKDTYNTYQTREYYVPERGWRERDLEGRETDYVNDGGQINNSPYNAALVKAKGRSSLASDPFAYIVSIAESSILSVEKNAVKQSLLKLCEDNEQIGLSTGAFHFQKVYLKRKTDANGHVLRDANGDILEPEVVFGSPTTEEIEHDNVIRADIDELKKQLAKAKDESTKTLIMSLIDSLNQQLIVAGQATQSMIEQRTSAEKKQHQVVVLRNGQSYVIEFESEKIANIVNKRFKGEQMSNNKFVNTARSATRYISAILTQYNPAFAVTNEMRDVQIAVISNLLEMGPKETAAFIANLAKIQPAIHKYVYKDKFGSNDVYVQGKYGDYLKEYMESGAQTGWSFINDIDALNKQIDKMLKSRGWAGVTAEAITSAFSAATEVSELTVRFAQYVTLREQGKSIKEAASGAKEISVNFDRKGDIPFIGQFYGFFNASLQGSNKIFRMLKDHWKGLSAVSAAFFTMGLVNSLLNPDDPDDEAYYSDYDRMSNYIVGGVKIPVVHFFRMFYAGGAMLAQAINGRKTFGEAMYQSMTFAMDELIPSSLLQVHNMIDWDDKTDEVRFDFLKYLQASAPTPVSPMVDVAINRNFMNQSVSREMYTKGMEEKTKDLKRAKNNTPSVYVDIANFLHEVTGGNVNSNVKGFDHFYTVDVSPNTIQHLFEGYTGGTGTFVINTCNTIYDAISGNEVDVKNIPVVGKMYKPYQQDKAFNSEYYSLKGKIDAYDGYVNDLKKNDRDEFMNEIRSDRYRQYAKTQRVLKALEKKPNQTTADVQQLMDLKKQWLKQ